MWLAETKASGEPLRTCFSVTPTYNNRRHEINPCDAGDPCRLRGKKCARRNIALWPLAFRKARWHGASDRHAVALCESGNTV